MKILFLSPRSSQAGNALLITMIMMGVALAILASAMTWSASSTRLTHRSIQYGRAIVAAEAATEKVVSKLTKDFLWGGEKLVADNLPAYRSLIPSAADSSFWSNWKFTEASGAVGTFVNVKSLSQYVALDSAYSGLRGFVSTYSIVAHARETTAPQEVVGGVLQEIQLARIPIFQFAMYSSGDMEISCGQPFAVTGQVHANKTLYVEPDSALTFQSAVTAVTDIVFRRHPDDTRGAPSGSVVYEKPDLKKTPVAAMTLPIGTTNSPEAIREIIQPPPMGESPNSPLGRLRYYNQADMVVVVTSTGISATSGSFNSFATLIPSNQLEKIITTTNSFWDAREGKTVKPIDINIGNLTAWSQTNSSLRPALGSNNLVSVYVWDQRLLPGTNLAAVRVRNGLNLPGRGLTVATARPLYVLGHYNQTNSAGLGTTNTSSTHPASLVADAITILSENWTDAKSTLGVASRTAAPTTVNAALLTGVVETTPGKYSGGMENFPRFLETWGAANVFTYNGSLVKMFPSLYATNAWGKSGVYAPPKRNWAYDVNFDESTKLPPLTPSLVKVFRGQWATVTRDKNEVAVAP